MLWATPTIDRLLMLNPGLIGMFLGGAFANVVCKRYCAAFGSGLTLHTLLALVIWPRKSVSGENLDVNQSLIEFAS